jgi:Photosynthetic reaction centre cytochrome C subunit
MLSKKKFIITATLVALVSAGVAAVNAPKNKFKNLKVLPQDISEEKLDSLMKTYNVALGVKCKFCHVPVQNVTDSLDYASDAEPMKENARDMMRMVIDINKTYFNYKKIERYEDLHVVTCKTCHQGEAFPPED